MSFPVISADSHITEPPETYVDHIEPSWRERAPHMVLHEEHGHLFVAEGMRPIKLGLVAAAGLLVGFVRWELARRHPMLDPRLFRHRPFALGSFTVTISFVVMFGFYTIWGVIEMVSLTPSPLP